MTCLETVRRVARTLAATTPMASAAHAARLEWRLDNVTFEDGETEAGSFIFDANTGDYSGFDFDLTKFNGTTSMFFVRVALLEIKNPFGPTGGDLGEPFLQLA